MAITELQISETLGLPIETVTETFAILGRRGSGKTSTAVVIAEEAIGAGVPVVIVDPTGAWWGLRSSADGKSDGLPVVIFGGEHADIALDEKAGVAIADAIVDDRFPAILDLSLLSKSAMRRFMADFAERLYRRNRSELLLLIDEADVLVPQRLDSAGMRVFGAIDDIGRRGRIRGLGVGLISQRPAVINKDLLSQVEILITLQLTSKIDVKAIDEWVRLNATDDDANLVKASLASLPVGTAWVWSPALLGVLQKVQIRPRRTFDSAATPRPGQVRVVAEAFARIDTKALGSRIQALADQTTSDDPKALRAQIRKLEKELAAARKTDAASTGPLTVEKVIEVPVLTPEQENLLAHASDLISQQTMDAAGHLEKTAALIAHQLAGLSDLLQMVHTAGEAQPEVTPEPAAAMQRNRQPGRAAPKTQKVSTATDRDGDSAVPSKLGKTDRRILSTLVLHGAMEHGRLALLSGYSAKASTIGVSLAKLRRAGLVHEGRPIRATPAGVELLGDGVEELPTGEELIAYWRNRFGLTEQRVLDAVLAEHPDPTTQAQIAAATGYSATASTIGVALSKLRKVGVVDGWGLSRDFVEAAGIR